MTERRSWVRTIGCYLALWISLASALSGCTTSDGQPLIGANTADKSFWNFNVWGTERAFTAGIESIKTDLMAAAPGTFELKIHYRDALEQDTN